VESIHVILALLLLLQSALIVILLIGNRRRMRGMAAEKQHYAEVTHAARLSVVGEITASIVHEVTQPLSAILSNVETAELLLQGPNPKLALVLDILTDVRHDDLRAYDIVKGLRSLLKKREVTFERVDINRLISDVLLLVHPDAMRRGVVIETDLDPGVPWLMGDPVHLQQVLLNLIVNGMEAMRETAPADRWLEVRTGLQNDGLARIEVRDNGKGIAAANKARLFDAFFTTKEEGMGLGLALAKSIVNLHGGSIWVEDGAAHGAAFIFTLPTNAQLAPRRDTAAEARGAVLH
jgi:signal transduction histidine kinase